MFSPHQLAKSLLALLCEIDEHDTNHEYLYHTYLPHDENMDSVRHMFLVTPQSQEFHLCDMQSMVSPQSQSSIYHHVPIDTHLLLILENIQFQSNKLDRPYMVPT